MQIMNTISTRDVDVANLQAQHVFDIIDSMDAIAFSQLFTPKGCFVFGNAPTLQGPWAIERGVTDFFSRIYALKHDLLDVWPVKEGLIARIAVTYTRSDMTQLTLPCANIWQYENELISDYRIYIDLAPLFSPANEAVS